MNCETGFAAETAYTTEGTYSDLSGNIIWVLVYPPNNLYYPQSPDACATPSAPPPDQSGGNWNVDTYLGTIGEGPKPFDIVVILAD
ncbi:MAG: hypothetical protein L0287_32610, partial [Anaerolineae bacterium]|nr:hypothetical protein [Anaerolineae bacterium]